MHILETLRNRAAAIGGSIVLPESEDKRTLAAAASLAGQKIAKVILSPLTFLWLFIFMNMIIQKVLIHIIK